MRAVILLIVLFILALACAAARGEDDAPIAARVLCDGARVTAIQIAVREPGVYTLRLPPNVCGRSD